jgi:hypothetical protein
MLFINKERVNNWFEVNYEKLKTICRSITKQNDVDELLHFCIEIVIVNEKFLSIDDDKGKIYYFTRVVLNNWKSKSSPYYTKYRKDIPRPDTDTIQQIDEIFEPTIEIDLEWVKTQITKMKNDSWYYGRLFELYIEENCSLTKLSVRTTIPINSLSRDIKTARQILLNERKKTLYGMRL